MWRFLRTLIAFILAFFLTMIIGGILIVGSITSGAIFSSGSSAAKSPPKEGWLLLHLRGELTEYERDWSPSFSWQGTILEETDDKGPTLEEIRTALEVAATKDNIKGIVLRLGDLQAAPAQVQQIGRWLLTYKQKAKKPVLAYGDYFTENTYYLASCADTILMYPQSGANIEWNGLIIETLFYRRFLEKWGVKPRLFRTGKYKSAAESLTEEKYSEANREQLGAVLTDIWETWIDSIALRRRIPPDSLRRWTESYIFFSARQAAEVRLVDALVPWEEWQKQFIPEGKKEPAFIYPDQLKPSNETEASIALVYMQGGIGPSDDISAREWIPQLQEIEREDKIKGVVLRVNSPGGAVLDSDKIARLLRRIRQKKPIVVSMSGTAASGGYYISAYANKIVAEPTTITGSIGVISILLDLRELVEKHIELRTDRVRVGGAYADYMSPLREPSALEAQRMQQEIDGIYREFLEVVRVGRNFATLEQVDSIGQGRVWSGKRALAINLVDTLGGIETALETAAQLANLKTYKVVLYPKESKPWERWFKRLSAQTRALLTAPETPPLPEVFQLTAPELGRIR
ncbi:MAG: signal peptide peptidase SppA [Bacteroidia bacterium]|nr:signal peptide peptidase SppA [Bacteroidia bacterium]MDW8235114.1 signal peptide peptidase SppA [Bacteroidia bacterium]